MGGIACNGWRFWSLAGDGAAQEADTAEKAPKATNARKSRAKAPSVAPVAEDGPSVPEGYDYEIDADGRPIYNAETPIGIEIEAGEAVTA